MISGDTIVAPATPFGTAGLAVVRISGPDTKNILTGVLGCTTLPDDRVATLQSLYSPSGEKFEEAIVTVFSSPRSYTGEDAAEISVHGNPILVQLTVDAVCGYGARLAEAGEFTQRAFLNGRMDLVQAESVAALIHSRSQAALQLNYRHLKGELSKKFLSIKDGLLKLVGRVEWWLDISEDESDPEMLPFLHKTLDSLLNSVRDLADTYSTGKRINEGYTVVIAGEPNVGKSTLMNTLAGTDRAITSHIPGTTRDIVDYSFSLDGIPITLVDTAGLRVTDDIIESKGIERTRSHLDRADLVLSLRDHETSFVSLDSNITAPVIHVLNKIDLGQTTSNNSPGDICAVSALSRKGIAELRLLIKRALGISSAGTDILALSTARQHQALVKIRSALENIAGLLSSDSPELELVSVELMEAISGIDTVLGKTTPDDILNNIFSSFCVGK